MHSFLLCLRQPDFYRKRHCALRCQMIVYGAILFAEFPFLLTSTWSSRKICAIKWCKVIGHCVISKCTVSYLLTSKWLALLITFSKRPTFFTLKYVQAPKCFLFWYRVQHKDSRNTGFCIMNIPWKEVNFWVKRDWPIAL